VIVIYGASGDLTARKLIPALYEMSRAKLLPERTCILGVSRTPMTDDAWRSELTPWAKRHAKGFDEAAWTAFAARIHYFAGDATKPDVYEKLTPHIESLAKLHGIKCNVLFYLSVAPGLYEPIIGAIEQSGLVHEGKRWCSLDRDNMAWQRIIVEKPFGHDAVSAASLNRALGRVFEEEAIYRIDHYLGKELVQSLLVFRFANTIFEPLWNHRYVDHVQITAAETVGVEQRVEFYDQTGAIRDMIQSHLLQVLALVAMEPPTSSSSHHIRNEKIKAIDAIRRTKAEDVAACAVLGQYASDETDPAYHENPRVKPGSTTETFAALTLFFDNWRWAGTPFYLRSGKKMAAKRTEIVVQFKPPAANLFRNVEPFASGGTRPSNRIVIEMAPREAVTLSFEGKVPGNFGGGMRLDTVSLDADYAKLFKSEAVEAYGPLIIDAMRGDQTLFKHRFEVESSWDAMMPFLGAESAGTRRSIGANYAPGSWGPAAADEMLRRSGRVWKNG
jgi:glucose-6-phosphate 1-dehydrogenase